MGIADTLGPLTVLTPDGASVELRTLWAKQPAVLVWVRHFGWLFCKQQVAALRGYVDRIHQAGGELNVIGNGKPEDAKKFIVEQHVSFPLYTDPSLRTYEAGGFHNGTQISAGLLWSSVKAMAQGHFQTLTKGTATQDGGAYVIDTDGTELFRYIGKDSSDHPAPERFLEALAKKKG